MDRSAEDLVGSTLGNYRLTARIGQGGMGEVYVAEHRRISRRAALKVLLPELSANSGIVERFLSEARTASLVRHPGIVEIFDCDEDRGRAFIVMELLEGETLAARMRREVPLSVDGKLAAAIAGQIARAVSAAHRSGVVHRDLKPDNVFLLERADLANGAVKVVDFGIAKVARPDVANNTQTGVVMGTPIYMSPEQCRGAGRVDHRTDIYSLGCILYEMVCGQPPFIREGAGEYLVAHLAEPPPDPQGVNPGISTAMRELILAMLAKNAAERPQSMDAVDQQLMLAANATTSGQRTAIMPAAPAREALLTRELPTGETRRSQNTGSTTAGMNTTLGQSAGEHDGDLPARRSRWLAVAGAALAAVAIVVVIKMASTPSGGPKVTAAPAATPPPEPVSPPPPPPPAPTPAPVAREIAVTVSNLPPGAALTVDGVPATSPVQLPREPGRTHVLRVEAPGYAEHQMTFAAESDLTIALDLRRLGPKAHATEKKPARGSSKAAAPSAVKGITDL